MIQALMQQQLSFEYKMTNIHQTHNVLDQLQRKMNSYFQKNTPSKNNNTQVNTKFANDEDEQGKVIKSEFDYRNNILNRHKLQNNRISSLDEQVDAISNPKQLQFKFYNYNSKNQRQHDLITPDSNQLQFNYFRDSKDKQKKQKERLSQTTVQKNTGKDTIQNRGSSNVNNRPRRNNEQFRLIGKPKKSIQEKQPERPKRQAQKSNKKNANNEPEYYKKQTQEYLQQKDEQIHNPSKFMQYYNEKQNISLNNMERNNSRNNLIHEMETIQMLMKQRLQIKQRSIRHLQQQIMTQNEERVYLYKINVRLNQQLKFLQDQSNSTKEQNLKSLEWNINKLQQQVQRLQKQISKKKKERKQLRKQQQTLKDGYQIVLNNKRNILNKDIQFYVSKQNKSKQNTEMLKGLIKQLDKLKGVVEQKIKSSIGASASKSEVHKRKVIKSFKN